MNYKRSLILFFSFWTTEVVIRFVIFVSFLDGKFPGLRIGSFRIHHFAIGFVLLPVSLALLLYGKKDASLLSAGISSALIADEFSYWTIRRYEYWSLPNFLAPFLIGMVLLLLVGSKTNQGHPNFVKVVFYFFASAFVLFVFLPSYHVLTALAQEHYAVETPTSFSQSISIVRASFKDHILRGIAIP